MVNAVAPFVLVDYVKQQQSKSCQLDAARQGRINGGREPVHGYGIENLCVLEAVAHFVRRNSANWSVRCTTQK